MTFHPKEILQRLRREQQAEGKDLDEALFILLENFIASLNANSLEESQEQIEHFLAYMEFRENANTPTKVSIYEHYYNYLMSTEIPLHYKVIELKQLMTTMENDFNIPVLKNEKWEKENPGVSELHDKVWRKIKLV